MWFDVGFVEHTVTGVWNTCVRSRRGWVGLGIFCCVSTGDPPCEVAQLHELCGSVMVCNRGRGVRVSTACELGCGMNVCSS